MVSTERISPETMGPALGYSHGMRAGGLVFLAGQIGALPDGRGRHHVVDGGLVAQFEKALENVVTVVEEAGGTPQSVVEMTVYLTDMDDYRAKRREIGNAWQRVMGKHFPAMTLVAVSELFEEGAVVELRAVAAVGGGSA